MPSRSDRQRANLATVEEPLENDPLFRGAGAAQAALYPRADSFDSSPSWSAILRLAGNLDAGLAESKAAAGKNSRLVLQTLPDGQINWDT